MAQTERTPEAAQTVLSTSQRRINDGNQTMCHVSKYVLKINPNNSKHSSSSGRCERSGRSIGSFGTTTRVAGNVGENNLFRRIDDRTFFSVPSTIGFSFFTDLSALPYPVKVLPRCPVQSDHKTTEIFVFFFKSCFNDDFSPRTHYRFEHIQYGS